MKTLYLTILALGVLATLLSRKHLTRGTFVLGGLLSYTFVHEIVVAQIHSEFAYKFYIVYAAVGHALYLYFLGSHALTRIIRKVIYAAIPLMLVSGVFGVIFFADHFPGKFIASTQAVVIGASLVVLIDLMNKNFHENLWKDSVFMLSVAIFLYHSFQLIYIAALDLIMDQLGQLRFLMSAHTVVSIIYYAILAYLIFKFRPPTATANQHGK